MTVLEQRNADFHINFVPGCCFDWNLSLWLPVLHFSLFLPCTIEIGSFADYHVIV